MDSTPTPTAMSPASTDPRVPGASTPAEDSALLEGDMLTRLAGPSKNGAQSAKSRRRRRPADSGNQSKNQMFYFVDSNSSSKEKRAHVMRHHVQEKRKQRKLSSGTVQPEQAQDLPSLSLRKDSGYDTDTRKEAALTGQSGSFASPESSVCNSLTIMLYRRSKLTTGCIAPNKVFESQALTSANDVRAIRRAHDDAGCTSKGPVLELTDRS